MIKFFSPLSYVAVFGSGIRDKHPGSATLVTVPDPGPGAFLAIGSGMGKKIGSGSGMNNSDHISESLETIFLG
jgi:hypothetical protein